MCKWEATFCGAGNAIFSRKWLNRDTAEWRSFMTNRHRHRWDPAQPDGRVERSAGTTVEVPAWQNGKIGRADIDSALTIT